jgi:hypothetical protein
MVVCLSGEQSTPFDTHQGTKQGSELSPLMFGLFIEQLHHLLKEKVPGAGPIIGGVRVPDIMYADDVNMMVVDSAEQMQALLDALDVFCDLFGMKVNFAKTKIIILRASKSVPGHLQEVHWKYKGQTLSVVDQEKYLGLVVHETKDMCYAAEQRGLIGARSPNGNHASHGGKTKFKRPDIICSLFDKLIRPVLSYGAHIWGPYMFSKFAKDPLNPSNGPKKLQTDLLRRLSGMGKSVHKASLYKEYGREG